MVQLKRSLKFFVLVLLIYSTNIFSESTFLGETAVAAYSKGKNNQSKSGKYEGVNSWSPYFTWIGNVENTDQRTFVQFTVGVGFLYLSKVKGNMAVIPSPAGSATNNAIPKKIGGFSYNKTPVVDFIFGYRILDWLKAGIALQNQNNVHFQSRFAPTLVPVGATRNSTTTLPKTQFRANLALNALYLKAMFELPWPMVWKSWMYALYFNVGVGPCWQSWTDMRQYVQFQTAGGVESTFVNTLKQKYGASALWQLDLGFRAKSASIESTVSLLLGFKFNSWGKVPNLGASGEQGGWTFSFRKPYSARLLYSFAPYLGAQWNF